MRRLLLIVAMALALLPLAAQAPGTEAATSELLKAYTIAPGDTLKSIAAKSYHDYRLWPIIWATNQDSIQNPERIEKGQKLSIYKLSFGFQPSYVYADSDNELIIKAYMAAYNRYLTLGSDWEGQRHWVLLEAQESFDKSLFDDQSAISESDQRWFAEREGRTYVAKAPAAEAAPAPAQAAQPAQQVAASAETSSGSTAAAPEPAATETTSSREGVTITFLETTDIHGSIFPYNFIKATPTKNSMAQIATLIKAERAKSGQEVVLLDDGDVLQGQPAVYYYNFQKTDVPHIWSEVVNYLDYDAVSVGNHDIEAGHAVYDKLYREIKAPVLCANAIKDDGEPYFKPYTVIERKGVKIAILGLITPKIPDWLPPQFWTGMTFADMVDTAKKWVPIIKEQEKPDLLIGLFHSGVDYSYGGTTRSTPSNENAAQLVAEEVPGFDMIFAGHDHAGWDGQGWDPVAKKKIDVRDPDGNVVYMLGAKNAAANVVYAKVDLSWNDSAQKWNKKVTNVLVPTEGFDSDPDFVAKFQSSFDEVKAWVDRPVGKLAGKITTRDSMFGDSAFVDLIHRIQLELSADPEMGLKPAQVSFAAPLTFDATIPSSPDGTMYVRDMFNLYQYENFLYTMDLTGQQIKDFLEFSYKGWFATMPNDGNHLIALTKDKNGNLVTASPSYNYDSAAGINYTVDVSKEPGSRITIESLADGTPFDLGATYTVAINSYRGQGGGGHLTTGAGLDKTAVQKLKFVNGATTKDLRFYLLKWFEKQQGAVTVDALGNWKIIPEDQAAQGKTTDYPILYPDKK